MSGWPSYPAQSGNQPPASPAPIGAAPWGAPAANPDNSALGSPSPDGPANPMGRIRLSNVGDVAKELKKLYRESRAGTLSVKEATSLAYLLNMLAGILTASDIEKRLASIEEERPSR